MLYQTYNKFLNIACRYGMKTKTGTDIIFELYENKFLQLAIIMNIN